MDDKKDFEKLDRFLAENRPQAGQAPTDEFEKILARTGEKTPLLSFPRAKWIGAAGAIAASLFVVFFLNQRPELPTDEDLAQFLGESFAVVDENSYIDFGVED